MKLTFQTLTVLRALLEDPEQERYGLELIEQTGFPSGTLYPILMRLERAGWVASSWEDPALHEAAGRPRRRYYKLTDNGAVRARAAVAEKDGAARAASLWRPASGGAR